MPTVINSKKVFSQDNTKVVKNKVLDVLIEEVGFSEVQSNQMFSINLDYKRTTNGLEGFGSSEGFSNISFVHEQNESNYFVNFSFDTTIDDRIFLLRNPKIKLSLIGEQYNPNNIDDDENGTVDDNEQNDNYSFTNTYDSEVGSSVYFSVLSDPSEFRRIGLYATIGILRLSAKTARVYVSVAYYSQSGNTTTVYKRAEIYLYANQQQKKTIGDNGDMLTITDNEIINEKTYFVPNTPVTAEYSVPSWIVKIRQSSEYYSSHLHYYYVNDNNERHSFISRGISNGMVDFRIANFFLHTGLDFTEETILNLQNCKVEYNGNLIPAHLQENETDLGDGNSVYVVVNVEDAEQFVTDWNDFSYGEKNFYLGYNEGGSEETPDNPNEPIEVTKISIVIKNKVLFDWKDGKETAVIRCSVPEDLSVFEIGDEVIPMVFGADGADRPMSRYRDGSDKVFVVVGTKFIYDGAVWQELTLQEKTQGV